ncbi:MULTISPECIES: hypothetical protein [Mesorhizobium]|uniref:Uncharacterized protein n=1 Tax=Mesorhizobium shonense TaxID=1209948 RepID=A0ABV2HVN5_9HYPH|nr:MULTISPECIES: hypothetical protein [unclassified Mesorhizobium]AZO28393.1 hypothetical protein EJ071_13900 [Mesorhizobium sp. M1B.F.Ca.ET.045.04.1.1]RWA66149.1 MAG: hypothetical protein EOQ29_26135 [Mesorhizobium sp.]TIS45578.1 MAG: hypothetical protein E5W96_31050 [Mesorhizobium sp.]
MKPAVSKPGPCRHFLVVPPHGAKFDNLVMLMRIEAGLNAEFAGFTFVVTTDGQRYDDFFLVPILGTVNDPAAPPLQVKPDVQLCMNIASFLSRYVNEERPRLN